MIDHVAIVGGGFAGSLTAINLLRHGGPRATLIERSPVAGLGLAYGAAHRDHLLNVRASNMSAFPDDPEHFLRWLAGNHPGLTAADFVPRRLYGEYLRELLESEACASGSRLRILNADAVGADLNPSPRVILSDAREVSCDAVVLAVGNLPPHHPSGIGLEALPQERYAADPWSASATSGLGNADSVLLLGTGLTMVDMALQLDSAGFGGKMVALSRRGLLPRAHATGGPAPARLPEIPHGPLSDMTRRLRERAEALGCWRTAVDELRPFTQHAWRRATLAERDRFLRHLRPWWDVHRHRIAPASAERIDALQASGRLRVLSGRPVHCELDDDAVHLTWRPRGVARTERLRCTRVINCTGPQGDLLRTSEPMIRDLFAKGAIKPDACRLGIDVSPNAEAIDADGSVAGRLFAVGPMTRGAFWEIVAVPDIRVQAWSLARRLSRAHWVEGEGL